MMDIKKFETLILSELKTVVENILTKNPTPNISAKSRAGAEISSLLEEQFVKATVNHKYFIDSESSPSGSTKHPYDAKTYFKFDQHKELIWIDFKAFKTSSKNSNPAVGSTNKIIELIKNGDFYLVYVFVYYNETESGLKFVKNIDNEFVKIYFLKDISSSFRRDPTGQLQVNFRSTPEIRTRQEFINLFLKKIKEGYLRQIEKSKKEMEELEKGNTKAKLLEINKQSEEKIKKL